MWLLSFAVKLTFRCGYVMCVNSNASRPQSHRPISNTWISPSNLDFVCFSSTHNLSLSSYRVHSQLSYEIQLLIDARCFFFARLWNLELRVIIQRSFVTDLDGNITKMCIDLCSVMSSIERVMKCLIELLKETSKTRVSKPCPNR